MESFKTVCNMFLKDFELSDDKLEKLKQVCLNILLDVAHVCTKHNLKYMLSSGTFLGAVRHKGFIPWDDDIDINMPREDYLKLPDLIECEFSGKYMFAAPNHSKEDPIKFLKVMLRNTKAIEIDFDRLKEERGIGIDIFPIENVPDNMFLRAFKAKFTDFLSRISSVCFDYKFPSNTILELSKSNAALDKYYKKRRRIGRFFSFRSIKKWVLSYEKSVVCKKNNSKYLSIPTGFRRYKGEMLTREDFNDLCDYEFEGHLFKGIRNFDKYLKNLYGDYMKLPPVEEREKHILVKLDFGEY